MSEDIKGQARMCTKWAYDFHASKQQTKKGKTYQIATIVYILCIPTGIIKQTKKTLILFMPEDIKRSGENIFEVSIYVHASKQNTNKKEDIENRYSCLHHLHTNRHC